MRPDWRNRLDMGAARPDRGPDRADRPREDWRGDRGQPGPDRPGFDAPRGGDRADWRDRRPGWDHPGANQAPLAAGRPGWRGGSWNPQTGWDRGRPDDRGAWNRGWRDDRRYDWSRYRATNRGAYRLPEYYAPSGWRYGYRRFSVGTTLWTGLWGSNYWIDDPFDYRLPEAYGPYRWVRYYDDALLVDVRNGRVVDVVYGIFF